MDNNDMIKLWMVEATYGNFIVRALSPQEALEIHHRTHKRPTVRSIQPDEYERVLQMIALGNLT